jgi:hypothetical protein
MLAILASTAMPFALATRVCPDIHSGGDPDRQERAGARRIIDADAL